jgi:transcriptional regulator with XRE-family HTH domain
MNKYDSKKLLTLLQQNHTSLKELMEHPAMYRWNAKTVNEVLRGQREISERFAKDIEKSAGIPLTDFFSDEYKSANQPNYSGEKLFDFMSKKGITTKEIERKMQLTENIVWKIITGKEVFTKSIAKGIAKLYNLSEDFFVEDEEKSKCCFLGEQCRILIDTKCVNCAFFKTKEQFIKDRENAKQKLIKEGKWDSYVAKYSSLGAI